MKRYIYFYIIALLISMTACNQSPQRTLQQPDYWPTQDWLPADPAKHDLDEAKLAKKETKRKTIHE